MPAANKSTGLQIALVFTVMGMIIAFVVAFLQYRAAADADAQKAAKIEKKNAAEKSFQAANTNLQSLRQFLGYPNTDEIGKQDAEGENSVIGQLRTLMAVAPGDLTQPTVAATLHASGRNSTLCKRTGPLSMPRRSNSTRQILAFTSRRIPGHGRRPPPGPEEGRGGSPGRPDGKEEAVTKKEKDIGRPPGEDSGAAGREPQVRAGRVKDKDATRPTID